MCNAKRKKIVIIGAGDSAREILEIIKDINKIKGKWVVEGFLDDENTGIEELTNSEYKLIGSIKNYKPKSDESYTCAIANPATRKSVVQRFETLGASFVSIIHPSVKICDYSSIGKSVIIYPGASVGPNSTIGDYVIIQRTAIAHDVVVGKFSTISSLCGILGRVKIGDSVFLGCGSIIIPKIRIGDEAYVGAGSVVVKNIKEKQRVFGNPAKVIDWN